jgi:hypothetical protein
VPLGATREPIVHVSTVRPNLSTPDDCDPYPSATKPKLMSSQSTLLFVHQQILADGAPQKDSERCELCEIDEETSSEVCVGAPCSAEPIRCLRAKPS